MWSYISIQKQTSPLLAYLEIPNGSFSLETRREGRGKNKINSKSAVNIIESEEE